MTLKSIFFVTMLCSLPPCFASTGDMEKGPQGWKKIQKMVEVKRPDSNSRELSCYLDESRYVEIEQAVIKTFGQSFKEDKLSDLSSLVAEKFSGSDITSSFEGAAQVQNDLKSTHIVARREVEGGKEFLQTLTKYRKSFAALSDFELKTFKILSSTQQRRKEDQSMKEATLRLRWDVRGSSGGQRIQDVMWTDMLVGLNAHKKWEIRKMKVLSGERLASAARPQFIPAPTIASLKVHLRREAIRRGGFGLSAEDLNDDGNVDLLVGTTGATQVFYGDGRNGFQLASEPALEAVTSVKSVIVADFDNKNTKDILFVRFAPAKNENPRDFKMNEVLIYRKNKSNGKYEMVKSLSPSSVSDYAMPSTVADFNRDSLLDIYVGYPGAKDFSFLDPIEHENGQVVQGLYWNIGDGNFRSENLVELNPESEEPIGHRQKIFPHSALAADINGDMYPDILVMDDRGNLSPMYTYSSRAKGFVQSAERMKIENYGLGMGSAVGDFDNDGIVDLAMTNVNFVAMDRLEQSCLANWDFIPGPRANLGLRLFKGTKSGKFIDVTEAAGLSWAGEGLAGIEFVDFDGDGLKDLYVTNGLWTGTSRFQDISSYFVRANSMAHVSERTLHDIQHGQSTFMDVLAFFKGDLQAQGRKAERPELAGHQRNRLFKNNGNGTFKDVAYFVGVDSVADGYTVARADFNNDGKPDLVLHNADPGSLDVKYSPVEAFVNQASNNHWLRLSLVGSKSNRNGIGAQVTMTTTINKKKQKQYEQLLANNGCVQSQMAVFFGMGQAKTADLQINWPSGIEQTIKGVKPGILKVTEPERKNSLFGSN